MARNWPVGGQGNPGRERRGPREQPFISGETVVPGQFECTACGHHHAVKTVVKLPVCPRCQNEEWTAR